MGLKGYRRQGSASTVGGAIRKTVNWSIVLDAPLLERLFTCWRRCYLHERDRGKLRRLFRSLEVAFHACLFPADGLTSMNDIGTRLALWVSAFEVLCHPGGSVNKRHVQKVLSDAPYSLKTLTTTRYVVSYQGKKLRATLPEALYDDLYWARNQFLHGMPVRPMMLRYRQSKDYPLSPISPRCCSMRRWSLPSIRLASLVNRWISRSSP